MQQYCSGRDIVIRWDLHHLNNISFTFFRLSRISLPFKYKRCKSYHTRRHVESNSTCINVLWSTPSLRRIRHAMMGVRRLIGIRNSPFVLGHRSSSFLDDFSLSGDLALLTPATEPSTGLAVFCFGLYEQSPAWSLLTQFSHGCLLSHFTFLCLHGQHAVPVIQIQLVKR